MKRPLLPTCLAVVAGTVIARLLGFPSRGAAIASAVSPAIASAVSPAIAITVIGSILSGALAWATGRRFGSRSAIAALAALLGLVAGLAAGSRPTAEPWPHAPRAGVSRRVHLLVVDTPRPRDASTWETRTTLTLGAAAGLPAGGGLLLRTAWRPGWGPGDGLLLRGAVRPMRERRNPGTPAGRAEALRRAGVVGTLWLQPDAAIVRTPAALRRTPLTARRALARARHRVAAGLWAHGTGPGAGLVRTLVLGERGYLSAETHDALRRTGTAHLVAVSGLHVGLVATALFVLLGTPLRRVAGGRRWAEITAAAGALLGGGLYVSLAGAPISAIRSLAMLTLVLVAGVGQRPVDAWTTLALAAAGITLTDPDAPGSPSFDLSFAAVASILLMVPVVQRRASARFPELGLRLRRGPLRVLRWALLMIAATGAATLGTAPVAVVHFGTVAGPGVAANLLAIPLLTFVVLPLALLAALAVLTLPPLAAPTLAVAGFTANLLLELIRSAATLPAPDGARPLPAVVGLLMGAAILLWVQALGHPDGADRSWRRLTALAGTTCAATALFAALVAATPDQGLLRATFLDVGQGDAALVELPDGARMLVDTGTEPNADLVLRAVAAAGDRLDELVITHGHPDHGGAAARIRAAMLPATVLHNGSEASRTYAGEESGARPPWRHGDARIDVLWPPSRATVPAARAGPPPESENDASIVLRIALGRRALLLAGDVEGRTERWLATLGTALAADVVKVAHHGSPTSSTERFVRATGAAHAVISCGWANRYGFPGPAVVATWLANGATMWRTGRDGAIRVETDGDRLVVESGWW